MSGPDVTSRLSGSWVLLTMGDRPAELVAAIESIRDDTPAAEIVVVFNGGRGDVELPARVRTIELPENIGIPAARDLALRESSADIVFFLDDDAAVQTAVTRLLLDQFEESWDLAVVSMRIVDEYGASSRRHVPRRGESGVRRGGDVPTFLGGACAIRRAAYLEVGGYWPELFYGHEELDLSWRLFDIGYRVRYEPSGEVFHPHTVIGRHADGWRRTGRNRVWIARRNLPWPIAIVHTLFWLVVGAIRAPHGACRRSYLSGWRSGWCGEIEHRPISWRTVWKLTRLGRPPVI